MKLYHFLCLIVTSHCAFLQQEHNAQEAYDPSVESSQDQAERDRFVYLAVTATVTSTSTSVVSSSTFKLCMTVYSTANSCYASGRKKRSAAFSLDNNKVEYLSENIINSEPKDYNVGGAVNIERETKEEEKSEEEEEEAEETAISAERVERDTDAQVQAAADKARFVFKSSTTTTTTTTSTSYITTATIRFTAYSCNTYMEVPADACANGK